MDDAKKQRKTIEWERLEISSRKLEGIFFGKMGTVKDRNGMDITEAEDIKKKWQEYTEELYKKGLNDLDNHDECDYWPRARYPGVWSEETIGSISTNKASGDDGIAAKLLQILKDDAVKVLHSIRLTNLENSAVATGLEKVSFHPNPKDRQCQRMLKLLHNCTHLTF